MWEPLYFVERVTPLPGEAFWTHEAAYRASILFAIISCHIVRNLILRRMCIHCLNLNSCACSSGPHPFETTEIEQSDKMLMILFSSPDVCNDDDDGGRNVDVHDVRVRQHVHVCAQQCLTLSARRVYTHHLRTHANSTRMVLTLYNKPMHPISAYPNNYSDGQLTRSQ